MPLLALARVRARGRIVGRRVAVTAVIVVQLALVVRGYGADHKEFAFQMFPESSTWQAEVVRVTADGERVPVTEPWSGYEWASLVTSRGLSHPELRHHADAGLDNQIAFLAAALDWVAANTPRDHDTLYLEATITRWHNTDDPTTQLLRSPKRPEAEATP